jgi:hypothetical protein
MSYGDTGLKPMLLDKAIRKIEVGSRDSTDEDAEQDYVRFTPYTGDPITYVTYGDCCSYTWIDELKDVEALLHAVVTQVEYLLDDESKDDDDDYEVIQTSTVKISTNKGDALLVYKNRSNGYYSGSLDFCDVEPEGITWRDVTSDYKFERVDPF